MKNRNFRPSLALLTLSVSTASGQITTWRGTADGTWNSGSNWTAGAPNGVSTDALFNSSGLNPALVLSANATARSLYLYGGNYSLSPTAAEVFTFGAFGGLTQLGSGTWTINTSTASTGDIVFNGTGTGAITLAGPFNHGAARLDKFNESDVNLTNAYTSTNAASTALRVRAGSLVLSGAGSVNLSPGAQVTVGAGSTFNVGVWHNNANAALVLDNTGTNNPGRITDINQINTSVRSLIDFKGNAAAASSESLGTLNASGPGSRIRVTGGSGQSSRLTFSSLQVQNAVGNTVDTNGNPTLLQFLVPTGNTLGAAGTAGGRVIFTGAPNLTNGVLRYGIVKDEASGGVTFATYDSTVDDGVALGVAALPAYTTTDIEAATAASNVDISGGASISATRTANAIRITPNAPGQALTLGGSELRLSNGGGAAGLIFNGGFDYSIDNTSGNGVTQNGVASYLYINSNTLTINAPYFKSSEMTKAGDGSLVINGAFNVGSSRHLGVDDGAAADDMTINGAFAGAAQLVKNGWGSLVLGGSGDSALFAGTASGGVSLVSGTVVLDKANTTLQNNALGSGAIGMNGGTLVARNNPVVLGNRVDLTQQGSGQNASHFAGDQAITFSGTAQGALNSSQLYPVSNDATANLTFSGIVQGFSSNNGSAVNSTLEFTGSGTTIVTGVIRDTDPAFLNAATMTTGLNKTGSGLLILQNANTYTGFLPSGSAASTAVQGGYLRADAAGALSAGNLLIAEANFSFGMNAVLELGVGNTTFNRNLGVSGANTVRLGSTSGNALNSGGFASVTGTSIINLNGGTAAVTWGGTAFFSSGGNLILGSPNVAGTVDFQNAINLTGNRTVNILNGSAAVDGIISGVIANGSGSRQLTKIGSGTLELTAQNTYSGDTNVSAGTLLVNNATGIGLASSSVNVAAGATLGGTGTLGGLLTATGTLAPGAGGVGTLTVAQSVAIEGSLAIEINGFSADRLVAGSDFGDLDLTNATLNITALAPSASSYIIASYTGGLIGNTNPATADTFASVTGLPAGYTIVHDTVLKQIRLEGAGGGNDYDTWAASFPGFSNADPELDFDNDGLKSLLEFVFGGNPTINDTPSIRPTIVDASGSNLVITFKRSDISQTSPLPTTVKVQVSDDLATWNPASDITIGPDDGSGPGGATYIVSDEEPGAIDTIVVTIPKFGTAQKFARVVATR